MTADPRPGLLRRLIRGRERWHGHELADMGTAFGLDQAFGEAAGAGPLEPAPSRPALSIGSWRFWRGRKPAA